MKAGIVPLILLLVIVNGKVFSSECLVDSIGGLKITYNHLNKPKQLNYETYNFKNEVLMVYNTFTYDSLGLLLNITRHQIDEKGDTLLGPYISKRFEYKDSKLSKLIQSNVVYDDIIWQNDKIVEYKYYYLDSGVINESKTRVLNLTYTGDNVSHVLYKELNGEVFSNSDYTYDDYVNPYYQSELALNDGNLLKYSCANNWIESIDRGTGENNIREITYNGNGYPLVIISDYYGPGRRSTLNYSYNCATNLSDKYSNPDIIVYPNPVKGLVMVKGDNIEKIDVFNLSGELIKSINYLPEIDFTNQPKGIYMLRISTKTGIQMKKIIVE